MDRTRTEAAGRLYLPSFAVLALAAVLMWRGLAEVAGRFSQTVGSAWNELAGPIVIAVVLMLMICERLWPAERRPGLSRGHVHDACFFILYFTTVVPLVALTGIGASTLILGHAPWIALPSVERWPRWLSIVVTLLLMDGGNWLAHWSEHRFLALWRFHAVHHTQEELSVLTSFRAHPLVHTAGFLFATVPVLVFTADRPVAAFVISLYLAISTVQHANVRWSFGPLGRILVSPAYHRLHHASEGPQNVNLGIVLTLWDVLAKRAVFPTARDAVCTTGLPGRPIIVEQAGTRYRPVRTLAAQLAEPFGVMSVSETNLSGRVTT